MANLENSSHRTVAQTLIIRALKSGNGFRCNGRLGIQDSGNTTVFTLIALFSLCCMTIQDDIDALAAMAMTCFGNHRFGMSEKITIYLNQLNFNSTRISTRFWTISDITNTQ